MTVACDSDLDGEVDGSVFHDDEFDGEVDGEVDGSVFHDGEFDGEVDGEVDGPSKCPSRCPSRQNKAYFTKIRLILDEIRLISSK